MILTKTNSKKEVQKLILPSNYNEKLALLYGILLGDGCLSQVGKKYHFISISGHSIDDKMFFNDIITILKEFTGRNHSIKKKEGNSIEINFSNKYLFNLLKSLGFPVGKKGVNLKIPSSFNSRFSNIIVRGYFATDGSLVLTNNNGILYPRIEFSSISKILLHQVSEYLKCLGMCGKVYLTKKYDNPRWHTIYRLQCNGKINLELFRNKVGFANPKHEIKYQYFKKICRRRDTSPRP